MSFKATASTFCGELDILCLQCSAAVTTITCLGKQSKGKDKVYYKEIK